MIPLRDDNPSNSTPVVTFALVALCVITFLWQFTLGPVRGEQAIYALGVIPSVLFGLQHLPPEIVIVPPVATMFTSMFMHGGFMHLLGNMLYLWIFGDNVEDSMGHVRFLIFYLLSGLAAVFAQALPAPYSDVPMVGASGAISGVLGGYVLLFPQRQVRAIIFNFLTTVPAFVAIGIWIVYQLIVGYMTDPGTGGVAYAAHIGGFITGIALIKLFSIGRNASQQAM